MSIYFKRFKYLASFWSKISYERLTQRHITSIKDEDVNLWAEKTNLFFVLATGRSGTNFFSALLNQIDNITVCHEPVYMDARAYQTAYLSEDAAEYYINHYRKKEIYNRIHNLTSYSYGEVNSGLRRHYLALKKAFPKAIFIHLVRDGRDVVRSALARDTMTIFDPNTYKIRPLFGDPWYGKWPKMDRFERLCWYWQVDNEFLRSNIGYTIQFEQLINDFDYFKNNLLQPLGFDLSSQIWYEAVQIPRNTTKFHKIPTWHHWDSKLIDKFHKFCSEEMLANGYVIK